MKDYVIRFEQTGKDWDRFVTIGQDKELLSNGQKKTRITQTIFRSESSQ